MEEYFLSEDLILFYVPASSFPAGVVEAFQTLEKKLPFIEGRNFFGISKMNEACEIIYKAAVMEGYDGEGAELGCETLVVPKGFWLSETLSNWMEQVQIIGATFDKLLKDDRLDPASSCVEWYHDNGEVQCMVKINVE